MKVKRFCRYYVLETKNKKEIKELEREFKKKMLQERYIRDIKDVDVEDANSIIYDSGEFDVLYSEDSIIKKFFFKPVLYSKELVVKATPQDLIDLQQFLETSHIEVREAKKVTKASLFISIYKTDAIEAFSKMLEDLAKTDFTGINGTLKFEDNRRSHSSSIGTYSGRIEQILNFRNNIIKMSESNQVYIRESVSFQD